MATLGRAFTERFRRKLRLIEGRLGLAEPTWAQFAPFFACWCSEVVKAFRGPDDLEKLDAFKAILEAMRDGECDCDGAVGFSAVTRWLYAKAAAQIDKDKRADFRRETERLWQLALTDQLEQRSEAEWQRWRSEIFA